MSDKSDNVWLDHEPSFPKPGEKYNARVDHGRMKPVVCPECKQQQDCWAGANDNANEVVLPKTGSIIICGNCGAINELTEDHTLKGADLEELAKAMSEDESFAKFFFKAMLELVHLRNAKKNLEALRNHYSKWCNDPDVAWAKDQFGIDLPAGSKVAVLTEYELREIYKHMVDTNVDCIGKVTKASIEKMFEDAGKPLK